MHALPFLPLIKCFISWWRSDQSILIETSSCNVQYFWELTNYSIENFTWCHRNSLCLNVLFVRPYPRLKPTVSLLAVLQIIISVIIHRGGGGGGIRGTYENHGGGNNTWSPSSKHELELQYTPCRGGLATRGDDAPNPAGHLQSDLGTASLLLCTCCRSVSDSMHPIMVQIIIHRKSRPGFGWYTVIVILHHCQFWFTTVLQSARYCGTQQSKGQICQHSTARNIYGLVFLFRI